jgi:DNA-binding Xre family transcriptional regulator
MKVVPIRQHIGNVSDSEPETVKMRMLVNHLVREYVKKGGHMKRLAVRANLNPATVSRLAYYETTKPRWETIIRLCKALDCMDQLANIFRR